MHKSRPAPLGDIALGRAWEETHPRAVTSASPILARTMASRVGPAALHRTTHERHHRSRRIVAARRMRMHVVDDGHDE
jgi:hypothetical protein